jgi:hypothetical protein
MPFTSKADRRCWTSSRANQLKSELLDHLGRRCAECGSITDLEINHIYGRDWKVRKVTHYRRVLRYWKEAREGLVNLLCKSCNSAYKPLRREVEPF